MGGKEKKKKRPTAHEKAIELLNRDPGLHFATIATIYGEGTVIPTEAVPALIKAFRHANSRVPQDSVRSELVEELSAQAIRSLEAQEAEAENKQAAKVKEKT
jgi:hypothetical protein